MTLESFQIGAYLLLSSTVDANALHISWHFLSKFLHSCITSIRKRYPYRNFIYTTLVYYVDSFHGYNMSREFLRLF